MESPIKQDREKKKLTQEELAKKVEVTREAISQIERGVFTPSLKRIKIIGDVLGASNKRRQEYSDFFCEFSKGKE
ncbi:helix-turn-helix transcriptional regulator [Erysipelotrichaceae bacterium OttesenSCG-928-M19]|nr:helix-turn-helix transcriptional regulator [Erysipelotrichaceae bacterium OttesenSCG-928-M19]